MAATWIDLLDPTADELRAKAPRELEEPAIERMLARPQHEDEPRPTLVGHGDYVFGVFLVAYGDGDEEDTEDVVAVPPERRARFVLVLRRREELLECGLLELLRCLRAQLVGARVEQVDPRCGHLARIRRAGG